MSCSVARVGLASGCDEARVVGAGAWTRAVPLLALRLAGCAPAHAARYPIWEPASPRIPGVPKREAARASLREIRALWDEWVRRPPNLLHAPSPVSPGRYSYVRAIERADGVVEFTVFGVVGQRVVIRALVRSRPEQLAGVAEPAEKHRGALIPVWVEREREVGNHADGAPSLTVEALYASCERDVLGADVDATPRLFFHPNGVLMHCGYLEGECSECPTISVHSAST